MNETTPAITSLRVELDLFPCDRTGFTTDNAEYVGTTCQNAGGFGKVGIATTQAADQVLVRTVLADGGNLDQDMNLQTPFPSGSWHHVVLVATYGSPHRGPQIPIASDPSAHKGCYVNS